MRANRLAVDVGGTFTDVVCLDDGGEIRFEKVPTTPENPTLGVVDSIARVGAALAGTSLFTHGTTLALNALLTRSGARTAVVATAGFRDVYLLGRTSREGNYDILYRTPPRLVERCDTFDVTERLMYDGSVHTGFDEADARRIAARIRDGGYESVAVAFLHSYVNPAHEESMREVLAEVAPGVEVSISSDLSREYREYERTSTAVLDAYIKPIVRTYLYDLGAELEAGGFEGRFLMMRSGGGAMTASSARESPVNLILSGPAGGVIGAAGFARMIGEPNLVTIDMGGTSLDASLIVDGQPVMHQGAEFESLPINISSLYIHTIGAGGGSIAWTDEAGGLQVGPHSAGADPGPASYGSGGSEATFTDAALVVGYLGKESPLGGTLTLDKDLALGALEPLAERVGITVEELALGVVRISAVKIMGAVRSITIELGRDPKDFALLAFGGAGGIVAVDVARELGMGTVIIPPGQGAFSALGMLMADVQHDFAQTAVMPLDSLDADRLERSYAGMSARAQEVLASEGFPPGRQVLARSVDLRYTGQEHPVSIVLPAGTSDPTRYLSQQFAELHERHYGHTMSDPVEVTTLRLGATGTVDQPRLPVLPRRSAGEPEPFATRPVLGGGGTYRIPTRVYRREDLCSGDEIAGPAVIVEHTATTVIHMDDSLLVGEHGELVIALGVTDD
ncbi:hydantoinase/oxoprolinase family protein [Candidatus Spongiisocius sp.]|uniref:hydantoinase/oxoprolinase family protein n=1 Tax=Candidatus Spongiisocius sp. TaxID=3101273 RepID=UPI003B5C9778